MGGDEFIPKLGRPGNRGAGAGKCYVARVKRAAKKLARPKGKRGFSGARTGRGVAAARMAGLRGHPFAKFRMRRVIVKVHIARAARGVGKAAFRAHVKYIQRDGVDRNKAEGRDRAGNLYDRSDERLDDRSFLERSTDDRHQFRIILSPEDADQLGDLKESTRAFMAGVEKDLGTRLDWVAVDHHDTGHPHTHIVIRGRDARGRDLVIARDYLTKGLRQRAQDMVMDRLGPRRDLEIARANANEIAQERLTGLDRRLGALQRDGVISMTDAASGETRFERTLRLRRMAALERLGLAKPLSRSLWRMSEGWQDHLRGLGKRGDIIRTLSAHAGRAADPNDLCVFDAAVPGQTTVIGKLLADLPGDELRDRRAIVIAGLDGKTWHVDLAEQLPGTLPEAGAIVEVSAPAPMPRPSDRTIAGIAAINGGRYSPALHARDDPGAGSAYIEAHKRRLEALRRAGLVQRDAEGVWTIGPDYVERATRHDVAHARVRLDVKAWTGLESQLSVRAQTWLDTVNPDECAEHGFGAAVRNARQRRAVYLQREGLWSETAQSLDPARRGQLAQQVLRAAAASEAARSGRGFVDGLEGPSFEGVYERPVTLATGRFALIARAKEFTLVPWRAELERHRGRQMIIKRTGKGVTWTLGKTRGIGR
ncbi:DUF3363 domain-containing protein [Hyphomonas sp. CY54-11-8]|uniref:DUF3363 domain-containing protein n=1 Tax=Hyphomonas sp. CY54-11-8 TaxID=1280944 RepID=UPI0004590B0D|nr:DUF3363 domain-containing protein [Hyphomonas sp. CY54-11-8]KCZ48478.1 hypothetical protein HY17_16645 [Hyphomonas sp. CY54-11-8]